MIHYPFIQNSGQSQNLFQTPFAFQNHFQSNGSVLSKECPQELDENLISLSVSKIISGLFFESVNIEPQKESTTYSIFRVTLSTLLLTEKRKIKAQSLKNAFLQKEAF